MELVHDLLNLIKTKHSLSFGNENRKKNATTHIENEMQWEKIEQYKTKQECMRDTERILNGECLFVNYSFYTHTH